jgi:hypothetical protein
VNGRGLGGWLPEALITEGRATDDFDTRELTVSVGATVNVLESRAGWSLCVDADGAVGWLPDTCLERAD